MALIEILASALDVLAISPGRKHTGYGRLKYWAITLALILGGTLLYLVAA